MKFIPYIFAALFAAIAFIFAVVFLSQERRRAKKEARDLRRHVERLFP